VISTLDKLIEGSEPKAVPPDRWPENTTIPAIWPGRRNTYHDFNRDITSTSARHRRGSTMRCWEIYPERVTQAPVERS